MSGSICWHITEIAATDWLKPNPRSPERADSAAWIGEVLDEPHTRELLETILAAAMRGAMPSWQPGDLMDNTAFSQSPPPDVPHRDNTANRGLS